MGHSTTLRKAASSRPERGRCPLPWTDPKPESDELSNLVTANLNRPGNREGDGDVGLLVSDVKRGMRVGSDSQQFKRPQYAHDIGKFILHEQKLCVSFDKQQSVQPLARSESAAHEVDLAVRALLIRAGERAKAQLAVRQADPGVGDTQLFGLESSLPDDFPPLRRADAATLGRAHG